MRTDADQHSLEATVARHLVDPSEDTRYDAYGFGREAVDAESGLLGAIGVIGAELESALSREGAEPEIQDAARRAIDFLIEYLAPFELLVTGMKQSLAELQRSHDLLRRQADELEHANAELAVAKQAAEQGARA